MSNETDAVVAAVAKYIDGVRNADIDLLRSAFHENAWFYGPFGEDVIAAPIDGLFQWVSENLTAGDNADHGSEVISVDVQGPVAAVKMSERNWMGHDWIDYFTLLKTNGTWKITCKSFSTA